MYRELLKWEKMGESSSRGAGVECAEELPVVLPNVSLDLSSVPPTLEEGSAGLVGFIVQNKQNPRVWASH